MRAKDDTDMSEEKKSKAPSLNIDWDAYGAMLDESDLTEDGKREFVATLWNIVVGFVDLGFDLAATENACGEPKPLKPIALDAVLNSKKDFLQSSKEQQANSGDDRQKGGRHE